MKRFLSLLLTLIIVAALFGCAPAAPAVQAPAAEPAAEPAAPADEPRADFTVTDMAGREVTIPGEVKSIATFGANGVLNAFVELMGAGNLLCNQMAPNFTKSDKWKMQYAFAPQIKDAPLLVTPDGDLLIEEVLKLQPDLCITMTKETAEQLGQNGLSCIYLEWKKTEDVKTAVNLMGQVLNKEDIAADYLAYFDAMVQEAADLTAGLTDANKKTVLYGNVTKLTQPHVIAEWWIAAAGGKSVTSEMNSGESLEYTQEDLLLWDPQVMIVTERSMIDELKSDKLYSDVAAVKTGSIYYIPTVAHVWGNRTVEQPLTIFWTINKLYPEIVSDDMLAEKISYFYSHFFKYDLSGEQLAEIMDKPAAAALPDLSGHTLSIYCGAGMTKPFQEIADAFKVATKCEMEITFANAAQIQTQINTAQEGDMFIAGSTEELKPVEEAVAGSIPLVKHIPVIAVQSGNPKAIAGLKDLAKSGVEVIIGDPESTPIGKIAMKAFEDAGIKDTVKIAANTPTAPAMATALAAGEADAAIVWKENANAQGIEIVAAADMEKYIKTIPAASLKYADDADALAAFVAYLNGQAAKDIWVKHGYELVG